MPSPPGPPYPLARGAAPSAVVRDHLGVPSLTALAPLTPAPAFPE